MTKKIEVVPYDSEWPRLFEIEATQIEAALADNCLAVHHVGSTSVPGLCAKPKIDIILVVKNMGLIKDSLEKVGYEYRGEFNIPLHFGFRKRPPLSNINLHVYEEGNPEIELNLLFRDYLRSHPEALDEYATLKVNLVQQDVSHQRIQGPFSGYNLGKDAFIKRVLDQAGFAGVCMRLSTHYDEWEAVRHFRKKYFFDKVPMADPFTWTFEHPDHRHLVLYQGTKIIGYAHIQLWPEQRAALWIIVIDESLRSQGFGAQFLSLCERWLKLNGFRILQAQASPAAYPFYIKHGYVETPFNAPDGYEGDPQDIDVGKNL